MTADESPTDIDAAGLRLADGFPALHTPGPSAEDRAEIIEPAARFDLAVDSRDVDQLGSPFVNDGVLTNCRAWKRDAATAARRARPDGRTTGLGEG